MKDEKENQKKEKDFRLQPSNLNLILERLPHRYPFLMVDRLLEVVPGQKARGLKLITADEELLQGFDPDSPRWPASFFIEALAQLAAIVASADKGPGGGRGLLVQVKNFRLTRVPLPGEIILLEVERVKGFGALHQFLGRAFIEEEKIAQGDLVFTLLPAREL